MPLVGNDWLQLTQEEAIEPELPICDPHHHLWDRRKERRPYKRYLMRELARDLQGGHNITSTVYIEARAMYRQDGPIDMRPVNEVEFANGQAAMGASGLYGPARAVCGIVGHANLLLGAAVEPVLEAMKAAAPARFKGIRHSVTWDPHPEIENVAGNNRQGMLADEQYRAGARVLARRGLTYDAWLFFHQLKELADFARAVPDLTIVLNHVGAPLLVGPYEGRRDEVMQTWRGGIDALAACPNVVVKLGGIGMPRFGFDWHQRETPLGSGELATSFAPLLTYCIEKFGPQRSMFESNFPVDKVSYSYGVLWNAFKRFSASYTPSERAAMFHDTALRVYSLDEAS